MQKCNENFSNSSELPLLSIRYLSIRCLKRKWELALMLRSHRSEILSEMSEPGVYLDLWWSCLVTLQTLTYIYESLSLREECANKTQFNVKRFHFWQTLVGDILVQKLPRDELKMAKFGQKGPTSNPPYWSEASFTCFATSPKQRALVFWLALLVKTIILTIVKAYMLTSILHISKTKHQAFSLK